MKHFANNFNPTFQNHHGNKSTHTKQSKTSWLRITLWLKSPPHHLFNKGRMENQQQEFGWFRKSKKWCGNVERFVDLHQRVRKKIGFYFGE